MAIFNITFDTESKACEVTLDGRKIPDVIYASIYKYYDSKGRDDGGNITVETRNIKSEDGVTKQTLLYAAKAVGGEDVSKKSISLDDLKTYAEEHAADIKQSVASWLGQDE